MENKIKNNAGFTMIELLLVVSIISVISAISFMSARNMYESYQLKGAARQVFNDLQYARLIAIKNGKTTLVELGKDASGNYYYAPRFKVSGDKLEKLDTIIYLTGDMASYKGIKVCHPEDVGSSLLDVQFNSNGTSTPNSQIGIKLSSGERVYRVYISSWGTGNIRILNEKKLTVEGKDATPCP